MKTIYFFLFSYVPLVLSAQVLLPFAAGTVGNSSWSTGEINIVTVTEEGNAITQGFQQPAFVFDGREKPKLTIYNGVLPEKGNDLNRTFYIAELGVYTAPGTTPHLSIFNRWGDRIYWTNQYQNDWNGKDMNGTKLPEGTYYYILKITIGTDGQQKEFQYKGSIHLLR